MTGGWGRGVPAHAVATAGAYHQVAGGWTVVGLGNRVRVQRAALGGAAWKALHIGGLITWHLLSSDGGSLALQPLTGMTFMPIPREEVFLLLGAQDGCNLLFPPSGCRIPAFREPFSPHRCKCQPFSGAQSPSVCGRPWGCSPGLPIWLEAGGPAR